MNIRTILLTSVAAGALAVTVGACTHSGDDGIPQSQLDAETEAKEKAQAEKEAAEKKAAEEQAAKEKAEADAKAEKERADAAEGELAEQEEAAARLEARALYVGIADNFSDTAAPSSLALTVATDRITENEVDSDSDATNGDDSRILGTVTLMKTGTVTLGEFDGTMYARRVGSDLHQAVVYNTQGETTGEPFFKAHGDAAEDANGYLSFTSSNASDRAGNVEGNDFPSAGPAAFEAGESVSGKYDGAPGTYMCSGAACVATALDGGAIQLGDNWRFTPATGAMTVNADLQYQSFGWWLRKNTSPDRDDAAAFVIHQSSAPVATVDNALQGEATYNGAAVGKVAIYSSLLGAGEAGHFKADAKLIASFGGESVPGSISGIIDDFVVGDDDDPREGWSVDFDSAAIDTTASGGVHFTGTTTWAIDGLPDTGAGHYSGTFYESETVGGANTAPAEAGGTFDAQFEAATARMIGAFAVSRED